MSVFHAERAEETETQRCRVRGEAPDRSLALREGEVSKREFGFAEGSTSPRLSFSLRPLRETSDVSVCAERAAQ